MRGQLVTIVGVAVGLACNSDVGVDPQEEGSTSATSGTDGVSTTGTSVGPGSGTASTDITGSRETVGSSESSGSSGSSAGNEPPAPLDDALYTVQDGSIDVTAAAGVLANDADADGDPLSVVDADATSTGGGTVAVTADGAVSYTPAPGFWGRDSFAYTVSDTIASVSAEVIVHVAPIAVPLPEVADGNGGYALDGTSLGQPGGPVRGSGDLDGDGLDDVLVGFPNLDGGYGRVYAVRGKSNTDAIDLGALPDAGGGFVLDIGSGFPGSMGWTLDGGGDVNGDGLADVVLGAGLSDRNWIAFGKDDDLSVLVDTLTEDETGFTLTTPLSQDRVGTRVASAGDVNADGLDDVVVNGVDEIAAGVYRDEFYVVFGKADASDVLLDEVEGYAGFTILGATSDSLSGGGLVDGPGDVNGDGFADVVVTSRTDGVCLVFGKTDVDPVLLDDVATGVGGWCIAEETTGTYVATEPAAAGDIDGDGLADLLVTGVATVFGSAPRRIYVVFGADTSGVELDDVASGDGGFVIDGEGLAGNYETAFAGAGDVNADGFADIIIGERGFDETAPFAGRVYVVYGKATTENVLLADVALGDGGFVLDGAENDQAGSWVDGAGDVDSDGVDDILVGLPGPFVLQSYVVFGVRTGPD